RPEGTRAEFHPALEPSDDAVTREQLGRFPGDVVQPPVGKLAPSKEALDLVVPERGAEVGVLHVIAPATALAGSLEMVDPEGRAEGRARISGSRLHPDPLERPEIAHAGVRDAGEVYAPRHGEIRAARFGMEPSGHLDHGLFEHRLQGARDVVVTRFQRIAARPGRAESLGEPARHDAVVAPFAATNDVAE